MVSGVLVLLFGGLIWVAFQDSDPPDESSMLPHLKAETPGGDPLTLFCKELQAHPLTDFLKLSEAAHWDYKQIPTEDIKAYLTANALQAEAFDRLMQTDRSIWIWPQIHERYSVARSTAYLSACQEMVAQIQRMRAELLIREGKGNEAADAILKTIRFADGLLKADGAVIHWLVAITILHIGEGQLPEALTLPDVTDETLRRVQAELSHIEVTPAELGQAFRIGYVNSKDLMDEIQKAPSMPSFIRDGRAFFLIRHFYQRNRTLGLRIELEKPVVEAADHGWVEFIRAMEHYDEVVSGWKRHWLGYYVNPNVGGHLLLEGGLATAGKIAKRAGEAAALHRQAILMIALRRYELVERHLPGDLKSSVPTYMDVVPEDPFDGAAMRWDVERLVLYSIGADKVDDHGSFSDQRKSSDKDVGMRYWWAPKPPKMEAPVPVRRMPRPAPKAGR